MNLNTTSEVRRVTGNGGEDFDWREGDGWLAGGTWLFSEPQPHLRRLVDLQGLSREPLVVGEGGCASLPPARSPSRKHCMRPRSGRPRR